MIVADAKSDTARSVRERVAGLRRRLVVQVDVIQRPLDAPVPKLKPVEGVEIVRMTPAEPGDWRALFPQERWRIVEHDLARGDHAHIALIDGQLAGWIWSSRVSHRDPWSGLHIRLAPDEAYTYDLEVLVPYRPLGAAPLLVAAMLSELCEDQGLARVYSWVNTDSRQSQTLLRMVFGFKQVQRVKRLYLVKLGWQIPGSDHPRFGPVSRVGWHSGATPP